VFDTREKKFPHWREGQQPRVEASQFTRRECIHNPAPFECPFRETTTRKGYVLGELKGERLALFFFCLSTYTSLTRKALNSKEQAKSKKL